MKHCFREFYAVSSGKFTNGENINPVDLNILIA